MTEKIRVAFLSNLEASVRDIVRATAPEKYDVVFADKEDEAGLVATARGAQVFITRAPKVTKAVVAAAPGLKLVHKFGIGIDKIDLDAVWSTGAEVAITAGANAAAVAEHAVMLMLAVNRRLGYLDRTTRAGEWHRDAMRAQCWQLRDKVVGIVGFGSIGRSVALCLAGFGATIRYYDLRRVDATTERAHRASYAELDDLLAQADIVSLHLPANAHTEKLIGTEALARMKPTAILINTARGELIDEAALIAALDAGKLRGAGLDVFRKEPVDPADPLLKHERITVTPHTAGSVIDNVASVCAHIFRNIDMFLAGQSLPGEDVVRRPGAGK